MSLWTPRGEHEVPREPEAEPGPEPGEAAGEPDFADLSPEERAQAEALAKEMAEVRRQLAETPAAVVVANPAMGLYELAAIHLGQDPPNLPQASLAIDAMSAIVDGLPRRLGENESTLKDALQQLRLAFVQLSAAEADSEAAD